MTKTAEEKRQRRVENKARGKVASLGSKLAKQMRKANKTRSKMEKAQLRLNGLEAKHQVPAK